MTKLLAAAFSAVAAINMGSIAFAQTAMSGSAMAATPTMVCRDAMKSDAAPNAMMGSTGLMCKKFDFAKAKATFMKMMEEMSASGTPTQAQINAAYQKAFGDANLLGRPQ